MCNIDHEAASPYTIHTAVLPKPSLINANVNSAITAMLDIVQPKNDDVDEDETDGKVKILATLKSLGVLANSEEFQKQLIWARDHPHSQEAKSLNAKVS